MLLGLVISDLPAASIIAESWHTHAEPIQVGVCVQLPSFGDKSRPQA